MTDPCPSCSALHCEHCADPFCPCRNAGHYEQVTMLPAEVSALADLAKAADQLTTAEHFVGKVRAKVSARV